ncbi:MAG TPA: sigma-54 dependent transcriptional regulator [Byssovorax sp.]|jgi:DNA-binding NtrC family response regulator
MTSETIRTTFEAEPRSVGMQRVLDLVGRVAKVDASVLFEGERGTGKERLARWVHEKSVRASGPFVVLSCANVPERLLESELFGHARAAFPGAGAERAGAFEAAKGGTLFLDDVTELPSAIQLKLARALEERKVRRMGEIAGRAFDVRVIAAATRKVAEAVFGGRFRKDLLERLGGMTVQVPPLRERKEDVLPLAKAFLARAGVEVALSPASVDAVLAYGWPGNERELAAAMERAAAAAVNGVIETSALPEDVRLGKVPRGGLDKVRPLEDVEKDYILAALAFNHGNQTRTAHDLRIGTTTLYRKLKAYGLSKPRIVPPPSERVTQIRPEASRAPDSETRPTAIAV